MSASIPRKYQYSDYANYSPDFFGLPLDQETPDIFNNNNNNNNITASMNYMINSPVSVSSFPESEKLVVPDCMATVPTLAEFETGRSCNYYQNQVREEQYSGLLMAHNFWPPNYDHMAADNYWGLHESKLKVAKVEESEVKVGRYSVEERKDRILRYLKKRNQRNFNKTIKYACRKTLADKRVRIRGRFAKNNNEDDNMMQSSDVNSMQENISSYDNSLQMIYSDDDLLQAAMAGLLYLPYITG